MRQSRRTLLFALGCAGVHWGFLNGTFSAQGPVSRRRPNQDDKDKDDSNPPNIDPKTILEANEKDIKKSVEKLFQLATELKAEVDKTDSAKVLSVAMLKKAEEIEKLAHLIRSRAAG
jgi:hypothetical protein